MSWIWWMAIEVSFGLVVMAINLKFRIYERTAATARHLRSEKARVGLRWVRCTGVAAVGMLVLNLGVLARSAAPGTGALVVLVLLRVGAFVVATIQTASEE